MILGVSVGKTCECILVETGHAAGSCLSDCVLRQTGPGLKIIGLGSEMFVNKGRRS